MLYYWLFCDQDVSKANWVFYDDDVNGKTVVKPLYRDLECRQCHKFSLKEALKIAPRPNLQLKSRYDLFRTCDDVVCIKAHLLARMKAQKFKAMSFVELSSGFVMLNSNSTATIIDPSRSFMKFRYPCKLCGIAKETLSLPGQEELHFSRKGCDIYELLPTPQSNRGFRTMFLISHKLRDWLVENKIKGNKVKFVQV